VRPRLAICGHVHEGRGAERVHWDLDSPNVKYKESKTVRWEDPGRDNKKQSIIDLTSKSGSPLANDGCAGDCLREVVTRPDIVRDPVHILSYPSEADPISSNSKPSAKLGVFRATANLLAVPNPSLLPATWGQGGAPPSPRCDLEALSGRIGRQETCIVNAAIMATSWPRSQAKTFNKPIVVDIDLPISKSF